MTEKEMFDNEKKTTQLFEYLKERGLTCALWGAGKLGRLFLKECIGKKKNIEYVIDNNINLQGTNIEGKIIESFSSCKEDIDVVLVTNTKWVDEIKCELLLDGKNRQLIDLYAFYERDIDLEECILYTMSSSTVNEIVFEEFKFEEKRISFYVRDTKDKTRTDKKLYFEFSDVLRPSNDAIACALCTLAGKKYEVIKIDLEISERIKVNLERFTGAKIEVKKVMCEKQKNKDGDKVILNFSGGFDSLAAMLIMPDETELVSIDFGGWFARERLGFERFNPHIVKTNFRSHNYHLNHWTFMGVGAILYKDFLGASHSVFGTPLEETSREFTKGLEDVNRREVEPFCFLGFKDIKYTQGLTEIGTIMVIAKYMPEIIGVSLQSLAAPKSDKMYKKQVLTQIVKDKFYPNIEFEKSFEIENSLHFGDNLAYDFLCFYIIKNAGKDVAEKLCANIPQEVVDMAERLNLSFYERVNCDYLAGNTFRTVEDKADFLSKLAVAGVLPYTSEDYKEYRAVTELLNKIYLK